MSRHTQGRTLANLVKVDLARDARGRKELGLLGLVAPLGPRLSRLARQFLPLLTNNHVGQLGLFFDVKSPLLFFSYSIFFLP